MQGPLPIVDPRFAALTPLRRRRDADRAQAVLHRHRLQPARAARAVRHADRTRAHERCPTRRPSCAPTYAPTSLSLDMGAVGRAASDSCSTARFRPNRCRSTPCSPSAPAARRWSTPPCRPDRRPTTSIASSRPIRSCCRRGRAPGVERAAAHRAQSGAARRDVDRPTRWRAAGRAATPCARSVER